MATAAVVGANGFVGTNLVAALLAAGWKVHALCRPGAKLRYLADMPVSLERADVCDPGVWRAIPAGADAVFFAAGHTSFWRIDRAEQIRVSATGLRHVLEAVRRERAGALILTSSAAAYGLQVGRLTEQTPTTGLSSPSGYVRSRALAELEIDRAHRRGLRVASAQPSTMLGPYDHKLWPTIIARIQRGRLRAVSPGQTSFACVQQVARAQVAIAERGRWGERYLLGGPDASFLEIAQRFARRAGGRAPRRPVPEPAIRGVARAMDVASRVTRAAPPLTPDGVDYLIRRNIVSSDKAIRELDYRPPDLDALVAETYRWAQREGLLR